MNLSIFKMEIINKNIRLSPESAYLSPFSALNADPQDIVHFTCKMCERIVINPVECGGCFMLYCQQCIDEALLFGRKDTIKEVCTTEGCTSTPSESVNPFVKRCLFDCKFGCTCGDVDEEGLTY